MKDDIKKSLANYIGSGQWPGSFLEAVLQNDLFCAVCRADRDNFMDLREIVIYVDDNVPCKMRGSITNVRNWIECNKPDAGFNPFAMHNKGVAKDGA